MKNFKTFCAESSIYSDEFTSKKYVRSVSAQQSANEMIAQVKSFFKVYDIDAKVLNYKVTEGPRTEYKSKGFDYKAEITISANKSKYILEIIKDAWIKDRSVAGSTSPQPIRVHYWSITLHDSSGKLLNLEHSQNGAYGGPKYMRNFGDDFPPNYRELKQRLHAVLRDIYEIPRGTYWKSSELNKALSK